MFKSINEKALKKARGQVANDKRQLFTKKQPSKSVQRNMMEDFIPHAPSGKKATGQEVEILKNILSGSSNSEKLAQKNDVLPTAKGASEAGAGEFVSYKKYTASGRSLASTKVVDLRSYQKPQKKRAVVDDDVDDEDQQKKGFVEEIPASTEVKGSSIDPDEEDDDAFFRRIFGDEYSNEISLEEKIAEQKANAFGTAGSRETQGTRAKEKASDTDPFSGKAAFVQSKPAVKRASKSSRPKKKKMDIDIISGGSDGDII